MGFVVGLDILGHAIEIQIWEESAVGEGDVAGAAGIGSIGAKAALLPEPDFGNA